jgi:hypothetical protein
LASAPPFSNWPRSYTRGLLDEVTRALKAALKLSNRPGFKVLQLGGPVTKNGVRPRVPLPINAVRIIVRSSATQCGWHWPWTWCFHHEHRWSDFEPKDVNTSVDRGYTCRHFQIRSPCLVKSATLTRLTISFLHAAQSAMIFHHQKIIDNRFCDVAQSQLT